MAATIKQPRAITSAWIARQESDLQITAKTLGDGSPNPNYRKIQRSINADKKEQARWNEFAAWVADRYQFSELNRYAIRLKTETIEPGTAFYRKNQDGTANYMPVAKAWEKYLESKDTE